MKREMKFRAWDGRQMLSPSVNMFIETYSGTAYWQFGLNQPEPKDVTLMQFTGFKDKFLKDIYEGDILKRSRESKPSFVALIIFDKGGFVGETYPYMNHQIPIRNLHVCDYDGKGYDEVIGNIYEHPELLTPSK